MSGWAILNSTSFITSWVLMTKGALGSSEAVPTHRPSPRVHHLHFPRDPWLGSDFRDGDHSRSELHNTHASIAAGPESGESRNGTSRWSQARQYEGLRS